MNDVTTGEDPTQAVLSESALSEKSLCDYVINVATGCRHGCQFCYVPSTPQVRARPDVLAEHADVEDPQHEWGSYVLYRDDLPDRLRDILDRKQTWKTTPKGRGIVGISFATDCYMDGRAGRITRDVVTALAAHDRYARALTRNPILALQDLPTFREAGEHVTIGSSIPALDAAQVGAIEPRAPAPEHRLRGLRAFADAGVQTFVSMSPTYPTQDKADLRTLLEAIATVEPAVVFHEPMNPRGANFAMTVEAAGEADEHDLANALDALRDRETWAEYAVQHLRWVQELGADLGLPVHLWPDKQLVRSDAVSEHERAWLEAWRERESPEPFARRDPPTSRYRTFRQRDLRRQRSVRSAAKEVSGDDAP
ncbi:MAG TPA: radical SAM protein [Halococcus sp.]|nr:radical SAM protein [Halococcus sp.]